jgi:hypothetical protein
MAQVDTVEKNDRNYSSNDQADTDAATEDVNEEFDVLSSTLAITSPEDESITEESTLS